LGGGGAGKFTPEALAALNSDDAKAWARALASGPSCVRDEVGGHWMSAKLAAMAEAYSASSSLPKLLAKPLTEAFGVPKLAARAAAKLADPMIPELSLSEDFLFGAFDLSV